MTPSEEQAACPAELRAALQRCVRVGTAQVFLSELPAPLAEALLAEWPIWARAQQLPPPGDWTSWIPWKPLQHLRQSSI